MGVVRPPSSDPSIPPLPVSPSTANSNSGTGSMSMVPVVPVAEAGVRAAKDPGAPYSMNLKNPDPRPLPEGWEEYYDVESGVWIYLFLPSTSLPYTAPTGLKASIVHPSIHKHSFAPLPTPPPSCVPTDTAPSANTTADLGSGIEVANPIPASAAVAQQLSNLSLDEEEALGPAPTYSPRLPPRTSGEYSGSPSPRMSLNDSQGQGAGMPMTTSPISASSSGSPPPQHPGTYGSHQRYASSPVGTGTQRPGSSAGGAQVLGGRPGSGASMSIQYANTTAPVPGPASLGSGQGLDQGQMLQGQGEAMQNQYQQNLNANVNVSPSLPPPTTLPMQVQNQNQIIQNQSVQMQVPIQTQYTGQPQQQTQPQIIQNQPVQTQVPIQAQYTGQPQQFVQQMGAPGLQQQQFTQNLQGVGSANLPQQQQQQQQFLPQTQTQSLALQQQQQLYLQQQQQKLASAALKKTGKSFMKGMKGLGKSLLASEMVSATAGAVTGLPIQQVASGYKQQQQKIQQQQMLMQMNGLKQQQMLPQIPQQTGQMGLNQGGQGIDPNTLLMLQLQAQAQQAQSQQQGYQNFNPAMAGAVQQQGQGQALGQQQGYQNFNPAMAAGIQQQAAQAQPNRQFSLPQTSPTSPPQQYHQQQQQHQGGDDGVSASKLLSFLDHTVQLGTKLADVVDDSMNNNQNQQNPPAYGNQGVDVNNANPYLDILGAAGLPMDPTQMQAQAQMQMQQQMAQMGVPMQNYNNGF